MEKRKIIAIVGPTASGKTGWGVEIARKFNGEIISADSRQVYRGLDIGTGKEGQPKAGKIQETRYNNQTNSKLQFPNFKQYNNITIQQLNKSIRWIDDVPQWLIDIVEPEAKFTMFDWLECARKIIEDIFARGKTPIVVGGTGLYVQALIEGFALETEELKNLRTKKHYSRKELEKKSLKQLQKIVFKLKILNFKLDMQNPHRLIRAIERAQSGETVTKKKPDFEALQIAVDLPRKILYQRINQRVDDWFNEGFIEEVQKLLDSGVDPKWLKKIGLEYRILTNFILCHPELDSGSIKWIPDQVRNDKEFLEMKQKMKFAIHAYARRQLTWFRRFPEIVWCKDLKSAEKEIKKFLL